jgi:hypothetical protein
MASGPRYNIRSRGNSSPVITRSGTVTGRPPQSPLPGTLGARTAALKRAQGAGTPPRPPDPKPEVKCALDYLALELTDKILQGFLNIQQHARLPSYISPPLASICVERHVGTGTVASGDPPLVVGPGAVPTLIADLVVPARWRGVINYWGVDVQQGPVAGADLRWRIVVNGRRVNTFSADWGPVAAGSGGDWAGPPFTINNPNRNLCVNLQSEDTVQLQCLNFGAVPLDVSAIIGGWIYEPTIDEPGFTVRTTLTDQH